MTASYRVQLIEGSTIFGVTINVSCTRTVNFESKLRLNSVESVRQFREQRSMHSFLSRNGFWIVLNAFISSKNPVSGVPLENVKESDLILMESFFDRSKKNGQRSILLVYRTVQNAFYLDEEWFLNREGSIV